VHLKAAVSLALLLLLGLPGGPEFVSARRQTPTPQPPTRLTDRIKALHREADALMGQERSVLGDLRRLEVERDLRLAEARQLDDEIGVVGRQAVETTARIAGLEQAIQAARPGLDRRLVDVYKLGQPGYARLLLGAGDLRDLGRATRLVSTMARMDQQRVAGFVSSVARLSTARATLDQQAAQLKTLQANAKAAADLASKAAGARAELVRQIDARRDLNAQMAGELELAAKQLQNTLQGAGGGSGSSGFAVRSIKPFRGALDWPVQGTGLLRSGERRGAESRATVVRNGLEIAVTDSQAVRSIHEGRVVYADLFTALGQLVIVDHGGLAFSLYGYLGAIAVTKGMSVTSGQILGISGRAPGGEPALYFELRIDGRPVDAIQWLKAR
jgi:septal ring factor EnvC (AmiA/AmiB activator)